MLSNMCVPGWRWGGVAHDVEVLKQGGVRISCGLNELWLEQVRPYHSRMAPDPCTLLLTPSNKKANCVAGVTISK